MKTCNCEHTYQTYWLGQLTCVICGEPWPDSEEDAGVKIDAVMCKMFEKYKEFHANHKKLSATQLYDLGKHSF